MPRSVVQFSASPEQTLVLEDPDSQKVFFDPYRQRILKSLCEPASASELARRLVEPPSRLYYHLRLLERHGLIATVGERRVRSNREMIYGLTAQRFETAIDDKLAADLGMPATAFTLAAQRFGATFPQSEAPTLVEWTSLELTPEEALQFRASFQALLDQTRRSTQASRSKRRLLSVFLAAFPDDNAPQ